MHALTTSSLVMIRACIREEVVRKGGGEEVRSVRAVCDVCAAHGDRTAVGVDVDAQSSSFCIAEMRPTFSSTPEWSAARLYRKES